MIETSRFAPQSKVWIYQSSRPFTAEEVAMLNTKLKAFAVQWTAHNQQLLASGEVIEDRFIVLMVDETKTYASGCSIDTSVHFIKSIETELKINLFDRTLINYVDVAGSIRTISISELQDKLKDGEINVQTHVFDPLVNTKNDFDLSFKLPLGKTWMTNFI